MHVSLNANELLLLAPFYNLLLLQLGEKHLFDFDYHAEIMRLKPYKFKFLIGTHNFLCVPMAQWLEHCINSTKVVGSIPREVSLHSQLCL